VNRSFTLNEAQMFQSHQVVDVDTAEQNKLHLFEAERQADNDEQER